AERIVTTIEQDFARHSHSSLPAPEGTIAIRPGVRVGFVSIARTLLGTYPKRVALCLTLVMAQAFLYNGDAFSFGLILRAFYGVVPDRVGLYLLPFALTNFLGPVVLGRLFDVVGRKPMIAGTLAVSAVLLAVDAWLFAEARLSPVAQTAL